MCRVCHICALPCIPEKVANKTSLTNLAGQTSANDLEKCSDEVLGGITCILSPVTHACVTGSVSMTCPVNSTIETNLGGGLEVNSQLQNHCEVCGGVTSGDFDSREGEMEVQISWGPNTFDGVIDELSSGILGYAVFAVNECGQQEGDALATIGALGIQQGTMNCCEEEMYWVTVRGQLPDGVTSLAFMVVALTSIGALPAGWITSKVVDVAPPTVAPATAAPATVAPAVEQATEATQSQATDDLDEPLDESTDVPTAKPKAVASAAHYGSGFGFGFGLSLGLGLGHGFGFGV